jgi:hypothetical protein
MLEDCGVARWRQVIEKLKERLMRPERAITLIHFWREHDGGQKTAAWGPGALYNRLLADTERQPVEGAWPPENAAWVEKTNKRRRDFRRYGP